MKCLILAAGEGKRLLKRADSKPLISLLGLSLIERSILTANKAGLTEFYVVTGYNGKKVRTSLDKFCQQRNIKITHIINDEWKKENGVSVLKAKRQLSTENFILMMADHVFNESILIKLMNERITEEEIMLAVDYNVKTNKLVDLADVTKVLVENERILEIGKNIVNFNSYDTGIFLCSPVIFEAIEESVSNGNDSLSGGIKVLARKGKAKVLDINDSYWIDVDDEKALKKAESMLLGTLKKEFDGPVSRNLNRLISFRITRYLLKTRITPNCISLFVFFLSLIGSVFFFLGGYFYLVVGGILAQISSILDGCDGEVARLKFQASEFGGWFDAVLDRYGDAFLLFGLMCHVYFIDSSILILFISFLAIIGTFMNSYTADKYDGLMMNKLSRGKYYFRIGRDLRLFFIFIGSLFNLPFVTLVLLALMTNTENIRRVVLLYKYRYSSTGDSEALVEEML